MSIVIKALSSICLLAAGSGYAGNLVIIEKPKQAEVPAPVANPAGLVPAPVTPVAAPVMPLPTEWQVSVADGTIRNTLRRWTQSNNWTFNTEHWAVAKDFPVQGGATFKGDFKQAVRDLLSSTDLTDYPVQPCFYSNSVLRVVPYAQICDKTGVK